ncbi:uncharacterized protein LOC110715659 [Chenopodium quinoa]|uniref:uncharacterized protein LOC110715659 n=1 Tax=Chenopodium quinoa TaxID=63459 RepID=UPI000B77AF8A|nr:uncharacterized protein LOC110715659 [Chenopodium quinoa]
MLQAQPSPGTRFYGGSAKISVWDPFVYRQDDFSDSTLVVQLNPLGFLKAGWIVYPERYLDFRPRLYSYFTIDNSTTSRCWDLDCDNGFVQVNNTYALGSFILPVSTIGDESYYWIDVSIFQDRKTGNWWLSFQNIPIGYWPASLFAALPEGAEMLNWGGTIYDSLGKGSHTETDMGYGLFPDVGTTDKASLVCSLYYADDSNTLQIPDRSNLLMAVSNPLCYNAQIIPVLDPKLGQCFSFGGPGRNPNCP